MRHSTRIQRLIESPRPWLTDGGLETSMVYHDGIDLPLFASLHLLESEEGLRAATVYFERFIALAGESGTGFVLDTMTWRSGAAWAEALGRSERQMELATQSAVAFANELRARHETEATPILVNGVIGPAGDGYAPDALLTPEEAEDIHRAQVGWLADAGADMISAVTFTHTGEAIGLVRAAKRIAVPVVVSFTVETDGCLPTGQTVADAIAETDAATGSAALYFMVNCAHPEHFAGALKGDWVGRIGGVRANASRKSHAELDVAEELDEGDPEEFGVLHGAFAPKLPGLKVLGGCCGTDDRHVSCAARHVLKEAAHAA